MCSHALGVVLENSKCGSSLIDKGFINPIIMSRLLIEYFLNMMIKGNAPMTGCAGNKFMSYGPQRMVLAYKGLSQMLSLECLDAPKFPKRNVEVSYSADVPCTPKDLQGLGCLPRFPTPLLNHGASFEMKPVPLLERFNVQEVEPRGRCSVLRIPATYADPIPPIPVKAELFASCRKPLVSCSCPFEPKLMLAVELIGHCLRRLLGSCDNCEHEFSEFFARFVPRIRILGGSALPMSCPNCPDPSGAGVISEDGDEIEEDEIVWNLEDYDNYSETKE